MKNSSKKSPGKQTRLPVFIVCILLAGVVWIAFGQTLWHDFVNFDDNDYVWENPRITNGLTLNSIAWAFTHVHAGNWHPLTSISHMLDVQLYGVEPGGPHLTNVLLHATGAILLFLALRQLTAGAAVNRRASFWASAFVAALFAIHPLRVESVAWISERKDVLSGVFFMLALWAYAAYVQDNKHRPRNYGLILVCFVLGLLCKPTLVTLPFVLLLLDYWPLSRMQGSEVKGGERWPALRALIVEKIPLFVLSGASCIATVVAQKEALQRTVKLTLLERAGNAVGSYATYLGQMFYPTHLAVLYPYSKNSLRLVEVILDLGLLAGISAIFFFWRKKYPFLVVGWLWYLGMLVPMIGLVQVGVQTHGDRYTYLAQIGCYIVLAWGAVELIAKWRVKREVVIGVSALVVAVLTACSYHQASFWKNGETLWTHAIESGADSSVAHYSLGTLLLRGRQIEAALAEFDKALQIDPNYAEAEMNVGVALLQKGDLHGAISHTEKAVQIDPTYFEAEYNLGNLFQQLGQPDKAIPHYRRALAAKPNYAEAHNSLGVALAQTGELDQAIAEFEEAVRLKPNYPEAHSDWGNALASEHQFDRAIMHHLEAVRLNPNSPQTHYNLGYTFLRAGRPEEAAAQFTETLRLNPNYTAAKQQLRNLGVPSPQ